MVKGSYHPRNIGHEWKESVSRFLNREEDETSSVGLNFERISKSVLGLEWYRLELVKLETCSASLNKRTRLIKQGELQIGEDRTLASLRPPVAFPRETLVPFDPELRD